MMAMNPMTVWNRRLLCGLLVGLLTACSSPGPEKGPQDDSARSRQAERQKPVAPLAPGEAEMLPTISRRLSPGLVEAQAIDAPGLQPVFLIGDDSFSKSWLIARRNRLRRLNAVGLVVSVASPEALQELRRMADGLRLIPVSGDDLAALLGISHYPVLVTSTYIDQ